MMTAREAEQKIHEQAWIGRPPGLERTRELLGRLGNPHLGLKFVHITGTNGKGSTAAMVSSVLRRAGYRTGLYTSPHLWKFSERFQIDGEMISDGEVARLVEEAARAEGVENPRIAVAGLNPHAGENGHMGLEDEEVVKPAIRALREKGMLVEGPFPSDTLFIESVRTKFDGIVAMYHDQGHIPFKMLAFDRGVNSTMGLPIIRTSVDHGTAFEIAWKGVADTGSLEAAIRTAIARACARKKSGR